jgi:AcrR family transcriptional regulator
VYHRDVARWEPNARTRLETAARELFAERGFDQTTVAAIAERACLTERTFFRYFEDKREVLFSGSSQLRDLFVGGLMSAPDDASPMDAITAALDAVAPMFDEGRRNFACERNAVVRAHPELVERELIKMAMLTDALADGLRERGVKDPAAGLAAQTCIGVFRVAFERWVKDANSKKGKTLHALMHESLAELRVLTQS